MLTKCNFKIEEEISYYIDRDTGKEINDSDIDKFHDGYGEYILPPMILSEEEEMNWESPYKDKKVALLRFKGIGTFTCGLTGNTCYGENNCVLFKIYENSNMSARKNIPYP